MDKDFSEQENILFRSLKSHGYIFPESEEELKLVEIGISKMDLVIPDYLRDPISLIESGRIEKVGDFKSFYENEVEENLAQAAREGTVISDEVRQQMEKDIEREKDRKNDKGSV